MFAQKRAGELAVAQHPLEEGIMIFGELLGHHPIALHAPSCANHGT
jgi:hypothetical protein